MLLVLLLMTLLLLSKVELEVLLLIATTTVSTASEELSEEVFRIEATSTLLALLLSLNTLLSVLVVDLSLL